MAQGNQPGYGPVHRGRALARSPEVAAHGIAQQEMGNPSPPPGLPTMTSQPVGVTLSSPPEVQELSKQVHALEGMMQQLVVQQQQFMQTMTSSLVQQQQQQHQWMVQHQQQRMDIPLPPQNRPEENMPSASSAASPTGTSVQGTQVFRVTPSPQPRPPPVEKDGERDVFARSDKWLSSLPTIDFSSWKDRISEALGFLTWMEKLTSWVGLGSGVFPNELMRAVKTQDESMLKQDRLTVEQQKRSTRLMHIMRQTFASHEKSSLILQTYVESESTYQQSGFVALRLLAKEFCLKSRAECLYFRSQLVNQTVKAPSIPEIVRKIEHEMNKCTKLLNSLDSDVHAGGLQIQEADSVMVCCEVCLRSAEATAYCMATASRLEI